MYALYTVHTSSDGAVRSLGLDFRHWLNNDGWTGTINRFLDHQRGYTGSAQQEEICKSCMSVYWAQAGTGPAVLLWAQSGTTGRIRSLALESNNTFHSPE